MDAKIKQLIDDLSHNPKQYESLITEYFNTFDIDSLGLTYDNFEVDIKKVMDFFYTNTILKKYFNFKNIYAFLNTYKFIKFTKETKEFKSFISTQKNDKIEKKKYSFFIDYLTENISWFQAYFNMFYILLFYNNINNDYTLSNYIKLLFTIIIDKYNIYINKELYKFQEKKEQSYDIHKEQSKILGDIQFTKNKSFIELYDYIKSSPEVYFKKDIPLKSNITLCNIDDKLCNPDNNYDNATLNIPKFNITDINKNLLTKPTGLCNSDLYNLLNNSTLPLCYNNKSFFTLQNDIRINLRHFAMEYVPFDIDDLLNNENVIEIINKLFNLKFIINGFIPSINYLNNIIVYIKNAIIHLDFDDNEFKNLNSQIIKCNHRYMIIYCSEGNLKKKDIQTSIMGGHKTSLIIDKKKKEIIYFDPLGYENYTVNFINPDHNIINVILALTLSYNISALDGYKFLYSDNTLLAQYNEHKYAQDFIYYTNITKIINNEKNEFKEWAGGYCGLWNYLYTYLLIINPHLNLSILYTFFYKLANLEYSSVLCKLLIKNFASHIEKALLTRNYVIPLASIDLEQLNNIGITHISTNTNKINIQQENKNNKLDTVSDLNEIINELTKVTYSLEEDLPKVKKLYAIAKEFSKYLFAKGGLALYAPDKVNFLKI
jgi:hypothetical protein